MKLNLGYFIFFLLIFQLFIPEVSKSKSLIIAQEITQDISEEETSAIFQEFLNIYRQQDNDYLEAETWFQLGEFYQKKQTIEGKEKAIESYQNALNLYENLFPNLPETEHQKVFDQIIKSYQLISDLYLSLGKITQGLIAQEKVLNLYQENHNQEPDIFVAQTLIKIALIKDKLGKKEDSLSLLNQALTIYENESNPLGIAQTLSHLGSFYQSLGDYQLALNYFNQALKINQEIDHKEGIANTFILLGFLYNYLGENELALNAYNQAKDNIRNEEGYTVNNEILGDGYRALKEFKRALGRYNLILTQSRRENNFSLEGYILTKIGETYREAKEYENSFKFYEVALSVSQKIGDKQLESRILQDYGELFQMLKRYSESINYYQQSLTLQQELNNLFDQAITFQKIAQLYGEVKDYELALNYYQKSLTIWQELNNQPNLGKIYYEIAKIHGELGNLILAKNEMEITLNIVENLRSQLVSPTLRTTYFSSVQNYYKFYLDLLMQLHQKEPNQGYNAQGFYISEKSRSRSLLDLLVESNINIRQGIDPELLKQEESLRYQLEAYDTQLLNLSQIDISQEERNNLNQEMEFLLQEYQNIQDQIRANNPNYASLTQPQPLTLSQIQEQILDQDSLLLQYSLGEKYSYLWIISKDNFQSYLLPPREGIDYLVEKFRNFIVRDNQRINSDLLAKFTEEISPILLNPLIEFENQFSTSTPKKRLLIISDGSLQQIPFSALYYPQNNRFLSQDYEIVYLPSASVLATLRQEISLRSPAPKTLAIFADPVFQFSQNSDQRQENSTDDFNQIALNQSTRALNIEGLEPLPGTRFEANQILSMIPSDQSLSYFDFEANLDHAIAPELRDYQILHFATHAFTDLHNPQLSGIILSLFNSQGEFQNGFLRLHQIFNLKLHSKLVVLSACQTGISQNIAGEGLIGFTRGFMYAGVPRIIVSLWRVNDQATAEFMIHFYRLILEEDLTPAQALRKTQIFMQSQPEWALPYYWAGFILQGEWR